MDYWSRPRRAVYGDGWKIDDKHTVICLDPEDGEMAIKVDGKIVVSNILPASEGDRLAPTIRRIIQRRASAQQSS